MAQEIPVEELTNVVQAVTWRGALTAGAVFVGFVLVAKVTGHLVRRFFSPGGERGPVFAVSKLLTYFLSFGGLATALGVLGIPLSSLILTSSALLIGVGFSLQHVTRDFIAGIVILVEQSIRKNDFISFAGTTGTVLEIGLRATQILSREGVVLSVPNHLLVTTEVANQSHPFKRTRLRVEVPLSIREDVDQVKATLTRVAREHRQILSDPAPMVRIEAIEHWGFRFAVIAWVSEAPSMRAVASELRFAIARAFDEHDIEFPMPELLLHARSFDGAPADAEGTRPLGSGDD
jgi:small-conductance mechanosensitive channel